MRMVRKCELFSFGAPTRRLGTHPSLLIIPHILGNVNTFFHFFEKTYPQDIHRFIHRLANLASIKTKYKN